MFARGALRGTRRRQPADSQAAEHRDRIELGLQGTLPGVRPEAVVVAPVDRKRDLLCQAGRDDQTHVGGDGGPRDLQRSRQVIERKGAIRDHQEAEEAAADAPQSVAPEVDTHTLDELLQRGRETFSFRHVALLLDAYCPSALRQVSGFARDDVISPARLARHIRRVRRLPAYPSVDVSAVRCFSQDYTEKMLSASTPTPPSPAT